MHYIYEIINFFRGYNAEAYLNAFWTVCYSYIRLNVDFSSIDIIEICKTIISECYSYFRELYVVAEKDLIYILTDLIPSLFCEKYLNNFFFEVLHILIYTQVIILFYMVANIWVPAYAYSIFIKIPLLLALPYFYFKIYMFNLGISTDFFLNQIFKFKLTTYDPFSHMKSNLLSIEYAPGINRNPMIKTMSSYTNHHMVVKNTNILLDSIIKDFGLNLEKPMQNKANLDLDINKNFFIDFNLYVNSIFHLENIVEIPKAKDINLNKLNEFNVYGSKIGRIRSDVVHNLEIFLDYIEKDSDDEKTFLKSLDKKCSNIGGYPTGMREICFPSYRTVSRYNVELFKQDLEKMQAIQAAYTWFTYCNLVLAVCVVGTTLLWFIENPPTEIPALY